MEVAHSFVHLDGAVATPELRIHRPRISVTAVRSPNGLRVASKWWTVCRERQAKTSLDPRRPRRSMCRTIRSACSKGIIAGGGPAAVALGQPFPSIRNVKRLALALLWDLGDWAEGLVYIVLSNTPDRTIGMNATCISCETCTHILWDRSGISEMDWLLVTLMWSPKILATFDNDSISRQASLYI